MSFVRIPNLGSPLPPRTLPYTSQCQMRLLRNWSFHDGLHWQGSPLSFNNLGYRLQAARDRFQSGRW